MAYSFHPCQWGRIYVWRDQQPTAVLGGLHGCSGGTPRRLHCGPCTGLRIGAGPALDGQKKGTRRLPERRSSGATAVRSMALGFAAIDTARWVGGSANPAWRVGSPAPRITAEIEVLSSICPHLGCPLNWHPDHAEFVCPCHGGVFDAHGRHVAGPPPRSMDPFGPPGGEWLAVRPLAGLQGRRRRADPCTHITVVKGAMMSTPVPRTGNHWRILGVANRLEPAETHAALGTVAGRFAVGGRLRQPPAVHVPPAGRSRASCWR